jgi:hypothetical protein
MGRSAIDLTGRRFGRLTVLRRAIPTRVTKRLGAWWLCKCECGNEKIIHGDLLRNGTTVSCGCYIREITAKRSFKDITGQRFGKLVALEHLHKSKKVYWLCRCDCGNQTIAAGAELRNGSIKSCGCTKHIEYGEAAFNALYYTYRTSRTRRLPDKDDPRLVFDIPKDKFRELTSSDCFYCGKPPSTVKRGDYYGYYVYNGLDRIDNTKGYTLDNVVPCCSECNFYKGSHKQDDFLAWIQRVTDFRNQKEG